MATVLDLMLAVNNSRVQVFYHKDTKHFDAMPISSIEWKNMDKDRDALIPFKDENNVRFLSYEEINHEEYIMFAENVYVQMFEEWAQENGLEF